MLVRLLQIGIGIFWLTTMGYLLRDLYFEKQNRLSEANIDYVLDTLYNWNNSSSLAVVENGLTIGRLNLSASKGASDSEARIISFNVLIEGRARSDLSTTLKFRGSILVSPERTLEGIELWASQGGKRTGASLVLKMMGEPSMLELEVSLAGNSVIDYNGPTSEFTAGGMSGMMAFPMPVPTDVTQISSLLDGVTAWQGTQEFGQKEIPVLLLKKSISEGQALKIYLTETGEPLKVETDIGIEAISDILITKKLPFVKSTP